MRGRLFSWVLIASVGTIAAAAAGCGDSGGVGGGGTSGPEVDCASVTVKPYGQLTIFNTCTECHDSTLTGAQARQSAPEGDDYDTYENAVASAEAAQDQVFKGLMPPAGETQPTQSEKDDLYAWVQCGTPQ